MRVFAFRASSLLLLLAATPALAQSIDMTPDLAVVGREATLRFGAPVDTLFVTYRPNSGIAMEEAVPVGGANSVTWTPSRAGVVSLATPDGASTNVSVRFDRTPASGVLILVLAGLILFGGAAFSMRALLSGPEATTADEIEHWPDT